jgi:hypothetical protein
VVCRYGQYSLYVHTVQSPTLPHSAANAGRTGYHVEEVSALQLISSVQRHTYIHNTHVVMPSGMWDKIADPAASLDSLPVPVCHDGSRVAVSQTITVTCVRIQSPIASHLVVRPSHTRNASSSRFCCTSDRGGSGILQLRERAGLGWAGFVHHTYLPT